MVNRFLCGIDANEAAPSRSMISTVTVRVLLTQPVAFQRHGRDLRIGKLAGVLAENAERFRHAHD